ncbi:ARM repeat-containing protein [Hysterangium stoloniferum]|nr:ARM repeat-containing protein [Hysterangium stoloniferum]
MATRIVNVYNLATLKATKNGIIGNPSRKYELASDGSIPLSLLLSGQDSSLGDAESIKAEAAHVISSLSYGSPEALKVLIASRLQHALIYSLSNVSPQYPNPLTSALTRALKVYTTSLADVVGPPLWGIQVEIPEIKSDASSALEEIFKARTIVSSMDVWLPFLLSSATQISISIVWIVALTMRSQRHRDAATQWLPPSERSKETKGKRGWERPDISNSNAPNRGGGWLVRNLNELLKRKDFKVQEAALFALAAVYKDSPTVVSVIRRSLPEGDALMSVIALTRSRNVDVQLAACLCATYIIRASGPPPLGPHGAPPTYDGSPALTIIHVLNNLISSSSAHPAARTKACYVLAALTRDEKEIEKIAVEVGSLEKVVALMLEMTPRDKSEWDDDEPEAIAHLREAILIATATLTLHWDGVRRDMSSNPNPFFPCVHVYLSHPNVGVRYAACQCARVLCRSISVLRTSVVDSGMGISLFDLIRNPEEDIRVKVAALAGICNLLNDFSPMRVVLLEKGVIPIIVKLLHSDDKALKLNAIWAIKNALFNAIAREKQLIMDEVGWEFLAILLLEHDVELREQAVTVLRNLADNDWDLVYDNLGTDRIAVCIESALTSANDGIVTQGLMAMANLGNGPTAHLDALISRPRLMEAIRSSLHHFQLDVRRAAITCVLKLVGRNLREIQDAGFETTLKRMIGGPVPLSGSNDEEVVQKVRTTLALIENNRTTASR